LALWSLVTSHVAVQLLKLRVRRERPDLPVGLGFLIKPEDRFSFPSGHAAAGLSMVLPFFIVLGGSVAWIVLIVGLSVGVSRCYLGVHYPGDVTVGWALAVTAVAVGGAVGLGP
jgi:undecaprenyl-diphosphatase